MRCFRAPECFFSSFFCSSTASAVFNCCLCIYSVKKKVQVKSWLLKNYGDTTFYFLLCVCKLIFLNVNVNYIGKSLTFSVFYSNILFLLNKIFYADSFNSNFFKIWPVWQGVKESTEGNCDCCHEGMMHLVLTCVYINVLPDHSNREDVRIQQRDTSVAHIWSNCNCWGDIPLRADQWLDRLTLRETIKQKETGSLMLHEHALRQAQGTIWRLWDRQDTWHSWEKTVFLSITKHTIRKNTHIHMKNPTEVQLTIQDQK